MSQGTTGFATVKAVLSGDTVVLVGTGSPPPEMQLSLSSLTAPRLSRHPEQKDESFGWASREFLRKAIIGRVVRFRVDYRVDKISRAFCTLWINGPGGPDPESINLRVARAGMARVNVTDKQQTVEGGAVVAAAAQEAEEMGLGVFTHAPGAAEAAIRNIVWSVPPADAPSVAAELAKVPQPAVVEQVINGSTLRVLLTGAAGSNAAMLAVTIAMAGIQCPKVAPAGAPTAAAPAATAAPAAFVPKAAGGGAASWGAGRASGPSDAPAAAPLAPAPLAVAAAPKPVVPAGGDAGIAADAKAFTESRLLHRDVILHFGGCDSFGNMFGRVEHPAGDIATELLKQGLARMVDFSIGYTTASHAGAMRAAERTAKSANLRIWKDYAPRAFVGEREYEGRVVEVVSGDTIVVQVPKGTGFEDRRVSLSSVRAPRMGRRDEKGDPWAVEAKEHLRRALIGRDARVTVDYTRVLPIGGPAGAAEGAPAPPGQERTFGTVCLTTRKGDSVNVAVGLIGDGLAEPAKHRADDERSPFYDDLLAAEEGAKAAKKGMHSGKEPPVHRVTDISQDAAKAKTHFGFLQRARTLRATVDFVFQGGRVKATAPSENCSFVFGIAGVRCPGTAKPASKGPDGKLRQARPSEPCGEESFRFVREHTMQQEVELEVDEVDKNGVMLGPMYIGKGGARVSLGAELLRRGLAFGIHPVVERVRDGAELVAAEAEAKAAKRGVWEFYVEPQAEDEEEGGAIGAEGQAASASPSEGGVRATVVGIESGSQLFILADSDRTKMASINAKLEDLLAAEGTQCAMVDAKKGKVLAALVPDPSSGAPRWVRARIEGKAKEASGAPKLTKEAYELWEVTLMDSGAKELLTVQKFRPLDAPYSTMPPLAREVTLALIRVPALGAEHGADAANLVSDLVFGRTVQVVNYGIDFATGRAAVALTPTDSAESVNEALVVEGISRIASKEAKRIKRRASPGDKDAVLLAKLEAAQRTAKSQRLNMWAYGDAGDSDDEAPIRR